MLEKFTSGVRSRFPCAQPRVLLGQTLTGGLSEHPVVSVTITLGSENLVQLLLKIVFRRPVKPNRWGLAPRERAIGCILVDTRNDERLSWGDSFYYGRCLSFNPSAQTFPRSWVGLKALTPFSEV